MQRKEQFDKMREWVHKQSWYKDAKTREEETLQEKIKTQLDKRKDK